MRHSLKTPTQGRNYYNLDKFIEICRPRPISRLYRGGSPPFDAAVSLPPLGCRSAAIFLADCFGTKFTAQHPIALLMI